MILNKLSLDEGAARFWTAVFGGITAIGLVGAGIYTLIQYFDAKERDRVTLQVQLITAALAAKQGFNTKHLELCTQAAGAAGTIASSKDPNKRRLAEDDFWQLYWGPLGIVEQSGVASAMVAFGECLQGKCTDRSPTSLALDIAHACRAEVSQDFQIDLPNVPERPASGTLKH